MAGIHRERPDASAIRPARGRPATDVGDGVWMSEGLSNSYLIGTDDGPVVVNCGMGFEGPFHRRAYDDVDAAALHTIILTQGHFDHVGGVDTLRGDATEVVAHRRFTVWRDDNERLEAFRSRNAAFAWMDAIVAAMEHARTVGVDAVAQSRPEPTMLVDGERLLTVGGRELVLIETPGGETFDSLVVWMPQTRTLLSGNLFGPLFGHVPNLVTMRGDRYRDALAYTESLDTVLALAPDRLLTGHFAPVEGTDRIAEEITAMRDAMRWVHDRTVDGMNAGADVHTLMREVTVPDHLDLGEGYGRTSWNVRAIWESYAGWFHHRSTTELYPTPSLAVATDLVAAAGADALAAAARCHVTQGHPVEALHLTDIVLAVEPDHWAARRSAVEAHEALLAESTNFWESAWLRRAIAKLTGGS
ncbi:MAG: MBL fold metallo-hydrolase [Microthrixaceae bacterium]|nr:MBL fold metallo-hydrolase [Microthrixaceae bacterium]